MEKYIFRFLFFCISLFLSCSLFNKPERIDMPSETHIEVMETVGIPTISPDTNTYIEAQNVSIANTTPGANIRYTTDGSDPTSTHGTIYGGKIRVLVTSTIKAIAYKAGMKDSNVASSVLTLNCPPGTLSYISNYCNQEMQYPTGIAISSDGKNVYVVSYPYDPTTEDYLTTFSRDPSNGNLTYLTSTSYSINDPKDIIVSPDGKNVYIIDVFDNTIRIMYFSRNAVTGILTLIDINPMNMWFSGSISISPDGNNVYYLSYRLNEIDWFVRNMANGDLTYIDNYTNATIEDGLEMVISPDGKFLYVAARNSSAVAWFARDTSTGALTYLNRYTNAMITGANNIVISPDGKHVYVTAEDVSAVAWFERDALTGELTYIDRYSDAKINSADSIVISPDGDNIYILSNPSQNIACFSRNKTTGYLTYISGLKGEDFYIQRGCAISPDGNYVYISATLKSGPGLAGIAWFLRN
jgi:6-phosphogluconolactonase (cycloisomerase 2 family)